MLSNTQVTHVWIKEESNPGYPTTAPMMSRELITAAGRRKWPLHFGDLSFHMIPALGHFFPYVNN